jgi:hypothetical protein
MYYVPAIAVFAVSRSPTPLCLHSQQIYLNGFFSSCSSSMAGAGGDVAAELDAHDAALQTTFDHSHTELDKVLTPFTLPSPKV